MVSLDNGNGFNLDLPDTDYSSVDYNMVELLNNANWGASQYLSLWSTSLGFVLHSLAGNPQFTTPEVPDFNLAPSSTSLGIDAGLPTLGAPTDYTCAQRNSEADVDFIIDKKGSFHFSGPSCIMCMTLFVLS